MAKAQRKANAKLKRRQAMHDATVGGIKGKDNSRGRKRPGSMNRKKSGGAR